MSIKLYDYQMDSLTQMKNGCILCGGVGSGKSITSISYYYIQNGGFYSTLLGGEYKKMTNPKDLYIITTARKRDTHEWDKELKPFHLANDDHLYSNKIIIDSWNNVSKYTDIENSFFIFDEQRVVGYGQWSKSFIKIAQSNKWILLSATPGDTWSDYIPVFIANGFYKNKTEFSREHIVYSRYAKFPKVEKYLGQKKLRRLRDSICVYTNFNRKTTSHHNPVYTTYDRSLYLQIMKKRWDIWEDRPMRNASELCYALRKIVNSDESRIKKVINIFKERKKVIVFYNFNYELELLKNANYGDRVVYAEWNGHKHEPIPNSDEWLYFVQYTAGAEGWNCTETDTIIFYSMNYSYKLLVQAAGRIDRVNTPYTDLYYYHLTSRSQIDMAIGRALTNKEAFNEGKFISKF